MIMFVGVVGLLGFFIGIGWLIYLLIKKKPKKKAIISIGICFVMFWFSVFNTEPKPQTPVENVSTITTTKSTTEEKVTLTIGQRNALKNAKSYLSHTSFSYTGLVRQLEYEGYSTEDSVFAVDNCGADWNEQAAKSAKSYISRSSFSRKGLIDQLIYEGFTQEQAEYGVTAVGY